MYATWQTVGLRNYPDWSKCAHIRWSLHTLCMGNFFTEQFVRWQTCPKVLRVYAHLNIFAYFLGRSQHFFVTFYKYCTSSVFLKDLVNTKALGPVGTMYNPYGRFGRNVLESLEHLWTLDIKMKLFFSGQHFNDNYTPNYLVPFPHALKWMVVVLKRWKE